MSELVVASGHGCGAGSVVELVLLIALCLFKRSGTAPISGTWIAIAADEEAGSQCDNTTRNGQKSVGFIPAHNLLTRLEPLTLHGVLRHVQGENLREPSSLR
jgi:hypothetical protein